MTKALNAKDGAASDKQKKQLAAVLGKNDKGKEVKAFAGVGSDDEEEGMLEKIKGLNMNITFQAHMHNMHSMHLHAVHMPACTHAHNTCTCACTHAGPCTACAACLQRSMHARCVLRACSAHTHHLCAQVAGEIPMPILAVDAVSFAYKGKPLEDGTPGKMGPELFSDVDFGLNMDSRVALGTYTYTYMRVCLCVHMHMHVHVHVHVHVHAYATQASSPRG